MATTSAFAEELTIMVPEKQIFLASRIELGSTLPSDKLFNTDIFSPVNID